MSDNKKFYGTLIAGATLNGRRFGKIHTDGSLKQCSIAGEDADGVIDFASGVSTGVPATLNKDGFRLEVECAGTVTAGQIVQTDADGKAAAQTTGKGLARALTGGTDTVIDIGPIDGAVSVISIPVTLAQITGAGDVLTNWTPGFSGAILKVEFAVTSAVTTAAKAADLNIEIGTTNLAGGVIGLTSANATPLGKVIAGSAITANNRFDADDTISIEAANVTAFAEGAGVVLLTVATP